MKKAILIAVVCAFVAAPALGDAYGTATVQYLGYNNLPKLWQETTVKDTDHMTNAVERVVTGIYRLKLSAYSDNAANTDDLSPSETNYLSGTVDSFCIDIVDNADGTHTYDVDPLAETPNGPAGPMGPTKAIDLAELLYVNWTDNLTALQAAAIQAAVWEIVNEELETYSVSTGNMQVWNNDDVVSAANTLLGNLTPDATQPDYTGCFVGLSNTDYQDYVVKVPVPAAA